MLLQHIAKGSSFYLTSIFLAYILGYDKFGEISIGISIITILLPISKLGLDSILVNEFNKNNNKKVLSTSFYLVFLTNIFLIFISSMFIFIFYKELWLSYSVLLLGFLFTCSQSIDSYYQYKIDYKKISIYKSAGYALSFFLKLIVAYFFPVLIYLSIILDFVIIFIFLIYIYDKNEIKFKYFSFEYSKLLIKKSSPIVISSFVGYLSIKCNVFIINKYQSFTEVGLYNMSSYIFEGWCSIFYILTIAFMPYLIKSKETGENNFKKEVINFFKKSYYIGIIFLSFQIIIFLVAITYNINILKELIIIFILSLGSIFLIFGYISSRIFIMNGDQKLILYRNLILLATTVSSSLVLTKIYGVYGSAIALSFGLFVSNMLIDIFNRNYKFLFLIKLKTISFT